MGFDIMTDAAIGLLTISLALLAAIWLTKAPEYLTPPTVDPLYRNHANPTRDHQ